MAEQAFEEALEKRLSKLIEEKIQPIRSSLLNLKQNQDTIATKLKGELLRTQRFLAKSDIIFNAYESYTLVRDQKPEIIDEFELQLTAEAAAASSKVDSSDDPLSLANEFIAKCHKHLKKLDVFYIQI